MVTKKPTYKPPPVLKSKSGRVILTSPAKSKTTLADWKRAFKMNWIDFKKEPPVDHGYYYIKYRHKDGGMYSKAIWWNGKEFKYKDYVTEVFEYLPERFDYYVPCMTYAAEYSS
jgi:hypothetical protein